MTTKYITICHCDICKEKVDKLSWFYWGKLIYDRNTRASDARPEHSIECCADCQNKINEAVAAKIAELKPTEVKE